MSRAGRGSGAPHIVHVITGLGLGGAEMMLYKVLSQMDPARHTAEVISLTAADHLRARIEHLGISVTMLDMRGPGALPSALARLRRAIAAPPRAVVQTWMYHADLLGGLAGRMAGRPVVWDLQGAVPDLRAMRASTRAVVRWCARLSARVPDRIISCGHTTARSHVDLGYDERRIVVIPNAVDTTQFAPDAVARAEVRRELGLSDEAFVFALGARLDPLKDHKTMFAAWRAFKRESGTDAHLWLFGKDMTPAHPTVRAWVDEFGAADLHLLGQRSDVARIFAAADASCLSSISEGLPNIVAEAMACGLPCVVTDVGDSAWVVGETGVVVPSRDPAALAAGLRSLWEMRGDRLRAAGSAARRRIDEHFNLAVAAGRYFELYDEVAAGR